MFRKTLVIMISVLIIVTVLAVSIVKLSWDNILRQRVYWKVTPPIEVSWTRFLNHPEAWTKVFNNVSSIPEFWNASVPARLSGKSIPGIVQTYLGDIFHNDAELACCYVSVPKITSQALNKTLTGLGLNVTTYTMLRLNDTWTTDTPTHTLTQ
jgi:hypothetical protein